MPSVSPDEDVPALSRAQKIQDFLDATWRELVRLEPYGEGALLLGFAYGMIALEGSLQAVDKGYEYICVVAPYVRGGAEHVRVRAGWPLNTSIRRGHVPHRPCSTMLPPKKTQELWHYRKGQERVVGIVRSKWQARSARPTTWTL